MEDSVIIDMFWQRHEIALLKAQQKYGKRIHNTALNILHSSEDAKECVNDTLLKAWDAIPPTKPTLLGAYLTKIARNIAINRWKAASAEKRGGGKVDILLSELQDCIPALEGPEDVYDSTFTADVISAYLHSTDQTTRVVFVLRYFHGESIRNISQRFQTNENNVKSILFRARKKLKVYLEKEGVAL